MLHMRPIYLAARVPLGTLRCLLAFGQLESIFALYMVFQTSYGGFVLLTGCLLASGR